MRFRFLFSLLIFSAAIQLPARTVLRPFPLAGYDADLGLGGGVSTTLLNYTASTASNYRWMVYLEFYASTGGEISPVMTADLPELQVAGQPFRLEALLTYRKSLFSSYYGSGGNAPAYDPALDRNYYYSYCKTKAALSLTLSTPLIKKMAGNGRSPLSLLFGLMVEHHSFGYSEPDSGIHPSLLFEEAPTGSSGGTLIVPVAGIRWDSRNSLTDPRRGMLWELRFEYSCRRHSYARITLTHTAFLPLIPGSDRLILAHRLIADALPGDPPFYKAAQLGGTVPLEGLGGVDTLRGVPLYRFTGNFKLLYTPELRWDFLRFGPFLGDNWHLEAVVFSDIGTAVDTPADLNADDLHASFGLGVRIFWGADFCIAADYGFWKQERGFYLGFGQQF